LQNRTYTVTQLTYQIKNLLEGSTILNGFTLKGEISNFVHHRTGHLYFAIKDENSQIRAIMFKGHASKLNFKPKDGDKVTITGNISVYPPQGSYSVQVTSMSLDGAGELYLKYLELKKKLEELGWFKKPKKELPKYPKRIGVVTSPTGAVIKDITNTINRRYRLTEIILYPALVQGPGSSKSISDQINKANQDKIVDALIVGRGGGSIEDLWGYNELETISAIYNSKIPIITAIGHETDTTLSDFVSDLRAPTPTAAAELLTPNTSDIIDSLRETFVDIRFKVLNIINKYQTNLVYLTERLDQSGPLKKLEDYHNKLKNFDILLNNYYNQKINNEKYKLNEIIYKLKNLSPENKLKENKTYLNNIKVNLNKSYKYIIEREENKLNRLKDLNKRNYRDLLVDKINYYNNYKQILETLNPLSIMDRGFSVITDKNKNILTYKEINVGDLINIELKDGNLSAEVKTKKEK